MKAVVITSYGGVEGIDVQEVDIPPAPTADRVRVRVHAAGLNRADILQRRENRRTRSDDDSCLPAPDSAPFVKTLSR